MMLLVVVVVGVLSGCIVFELETVMTPPQAVLLCGCVVALVSILFVFVRESQVDQHVLSFQSEVDWINSYTARFNDLRTGIGMPLEYPCLENRITVEMVKKFVCENPTPRGNNGFMDTLFWQALLFSVFGLTSEEED
jgi:hypothetical protein